MNVSDAKGYKRSNTREQVTVFYFFYVNHIGKLMQPIQNPIVDICTSLFLEVFPECISLKLINMESRPSLAFYVNFSDILTNYTEA